jgi:hypothetical protein
MYSDRSETKGILHKAKPRMTEVKRKEYIERNRKGSKWIKKLRSMIGLKSL